MARLPVPDRAMLTRPEFQDRFIAMIREALRARPRGAQWDTALTVGPWDFCYQDIRSEVCLWHGEMDANAPLAMGALHGGGYSKQPSLLLSLRGSFITDIEAPRRNSERSDRIRAFCERSCPSTNSAAGETA